MTNITEIPKISAPTFSKEQLENLITNLNRLSKIGNGLTNEQETNLSHWNCELLKLTSSSEQKKETSSQISKLREDINQ